jgi:hypothetical protein
MPLYLATALLLSAGSVGAAAAPPRDQPPLTEVRQIRTLSAEEAALGRPVHLRGTVTYYHYLQEWNPLFVQDATGGIYIQLGAGDAHVEPGDEVEVDGLTGPGRFAPLVVDPRIRVVGHGTLSPPSPRTIDELLAGSWDSQWVEVEGVVRRVERHPSAGLFLITLTQNRRTFRCVVRAPEASSAPPLVDARVRVTGATGTLFTRKRQILGVQIFAPGFESVHVVTPAAVDPFDRPVRPMGALFQFDPRGADGQRVRVEGRVTSVAEAATLFVQDESGGLKVELEHPVSGLRRGDVLDIVGFPELGEYSPMLESAQARRRRWEALPEPRLVTADEALTGDYDSLPVEIEGLLLDQTPSGSGASLTVKADAETFQATVGRRRPEGLGIGSLVRLRGICLVQPGPDNRVRSFRLALDSPDDIVVLRVGSWWTAERALWTLMGLSALILLALAWNLMLRRRVELELTRSRVLRGLLPICAWCKKIRDDKGYWKQVEIYIHQHSSADFSHGICPDCQDRELGRLRDPS